MGERSSMPRDAPGLSTSAAPSMIPAWSYLLRSSTSPMRWWSFPGLLEEMVEVGGFVVGREVNASGVALVCRDTKPAIGGEWCEAHHVGLTLSGQWGVAMKDGRTLEFRPGDVFSVPPGHIQLDDR